MASGIVAAFGSGDSENTERKANPVVKFEVKVADTESGTPTFRVLAKRADGSGSKYQNLILYIDTADSLRAFQATLPTIAKALAAVDAKQVELGVWKPSATPAPAAPAAPAAAPATPPKSKIASAFDDLPW